MIPVLETIKEKIVSAFNVADEVMRGKAVETIEYEVGELDNIFAILVLGAFIGIPSPPIHITMELIAGNGERIGDHARKGFNRP